MSSRCGIYADDACAYGRLLDLRHWWDKLCKDGPGFGYFPNACKTWLATKDRCRTEAETVFTGTNVKLTSDRRPYLGSAIGSNSYIKQFVEDWSADVTQLAKIAPSQPHVAYSAFNKGLASQWIYALRTVPGVARLLQPLEDVIRFVFIPALTGQAPPNDVERNLFALQEFV